ncbi:MAG TPA: YibE/F family protein [Ruminiclostridium sp.]|nr:YibE/F family protein [Ruminiclostridium sp.]
MKIPYSKQKTKKLVNRLREKLKDRRSKLKLGGIILLILLSISGFYFTTINESFYTKPVAKIVTVINSEDSKEEDVYGNAEQIYNQKLTAVIMNGADKGKEIKLGNRTTYSHVFDDQYKQNDEVFISYKTESNGGIVSAKILDFKRDKYIAYIAIVFVLLIVLIGGAKGLRSLAAVIINIFISYLLIVFYLRGLNVILLSLCASVFFIVLSILLVNGKNRKSIAAIIGTMAGTLLSMAITLVVIAALNARGMHYEEMEFIAKDPSKIFLIEILIGTLGGIMDIAISISAAIEELYHKNPDIDKKLIIKSGREIGKDIMGTMANTLVFAYISGSMPMIILWLKNGFSTFNIINYNISLEIIRALAGSIGIVLSIPITLYISVFLLGKKRIGAKL